MPHIRQNRCRWLMPYEYGATVNAPSKKGSCAWQKPFIFGEIRDFAARPAQDLGAMVACANGNCGKVTTGAASTARWPRSNSLRRSKKLERK